MEAFETGGDSVNCCMTQKYKFCMESNFVHVRNRSMESHFVHINFVWNRISYEIEVWNRILYKIQFCMPRNTILYESEIYRYKN